MAESLIDCVADAIEKADTLAVHHGNRKNKMRYLAKAAIGVMGDVPEKDSIKGQEVLSTHTLIEAIRLYLFTIPAMHDKPLSCEKAAVEIDQLIRQHATDQSQDMVERIARAFCENDPYHPGQHADDRDAVVKALWHEYIPAAKAAIAAMQEGK